MSFDWRIWCDDVASYSRGNVACSSVITSRSIMCGACAMTRRERWPKCRVNRLFTKRNEAPKVSYSDRPVERTIGEDVDDTSPESAASGPGSRALLFFTAAPLPFTAAAAVVAPVVFVALPTRETTAVGAGVGRDGRRDRETFLLAPKVKNECTMSELFRPEIL